MLKRRGFLSLAAAAPAALSAFPGQAQARAACLPDMTTLKSRKPGKWEVLYKTPHGQPNAIALSGNPGQVWVVDQGAEHWVSLINLRDGSLVRDIKADVVGPSGAVVDEEGVMWITSTHNSLIVACDPKDGRTIAKYITPGAGRIYERQDDPPARVTTLKHAYPQAARGLGPAMHNNVGNKTGTKLGPGRLPLDAEEGSGGTGAHGILADGDYLIYACPPSRMIFTIHKKSWKVKATWPTPANRPHGLTWGADRKTIWNADSNTNCFYHHDAATGVIFEKIQLPDDSPVIHGAKLIGDYMVCCDDVGWIWRFRI